MRRLRIIFCIASIILSSGISRGQRIEAGVKSSAKSFGAALNIRGRQSTSRFEICADLYKVIDGTFSSPGYRAGYQISFPLICKDLSESCTFRFEAGPGMTAGFVRDGDKDRGLLGGVSGIAVIDLIFNKLTISCSATAILGFHLNYHNSEFGTLELYRNGLKYAGIPEIAIKYRF